MGALTLDELDEIEEMADALAVLEEQHVDAVSEWHALRPTPAGGRHSDSGYRVYCDIYSFGSRRLSLERDISDLLDGFIVRKAKEED